MIRLALSGLGNRVLPKKPESSSWLGWLPRLLAHPGISLAAAFDPGETARQRLADLETGIPLTPSYEAMLDTPGLHAVFVASPADTHYPQAMAALSRGLHVLVEKPLAQTAQEARDLASAAQRHGVVCAVVQNWRAKAVGQALRQAIGDGLTGEVGHILFRYVRNREHAFYPDYIFREPYPLLYAMGSHHLDLFRYILGEELTVVSGHAFKPPWSRYQSQTGHHLWLESASGIKVSYVGTVSSKNTAIPMESLLVEGNLGTLVNDSGWSDPPLFFHTHDGQSLDLTASVAETSVRGQYDAADALILEDFLTCLPRRGTPLCSAQDASHSIALIEKAIAVCTEAKPCP